VCVRVGGENVQCVCVWVCVCVGVCVWVERMCSVCARTVATVLQKNVFRGTSVSSWKHEFHVTGF